jgi:two-component system NarL family sensor kinase
MIDPNSIITISFFGVALAVMILSFFVFFIFKYRQRQEQHKLEKELLLMEMTKAQLEIQEQTMQNISLEIHDNIGQTLSLAKMHINTLNAENLEQQKTESRDLITRAVQSLRDLSKSLNGDYILDLGLEGAIQRELKVIEAAGLFHTDYQSDDKDLGLEEQQEVIIFRCVQEALNNAVKHSDASLLSVEVRCRNKEVIISVVDNGKGFPENKVNSVGMHSIERRIKMLGGKFIMSNQNGGGAQLIFTIPIHSREYAV